MEPVSTALGVLTYIVGKLAGGVDVSKVVNARIDRNARLLDDRTTKEINADAATSEFQLASTDVQTKLKLALGDASVEAIAKHNPVMLGWIARIWEYAEREQWNIGKTLSFAAAALKPGEPGSAPSDEWVHFYQDGAKFASDHDLQQLWGSVLAQEIRQTGSVSKRTMAVLKTIDKPTAIAFQRMRSQAIGYWRGGTNPEYMVPRTHDDDEKDDRLAMPFHTREIMNADGLLVSSFPGQAAIMPAWGPVVEYQGKSWALKPAGSSEPRTEDKVTITCSPMGLTGNEIAKVVSVTRNEEHERKLIEYLASKDVSMVPLPPDCAFGQPIPEKYHQYVIEY